MRFGNGTPGWAADFSRKQWSIQFLDFAAFRAIAILFEIYPTAAAPLVVAIVRSRCLR